MTSDLYYPWTSYLFCTTSTISHMLINVYDIYLAAYDWMASNGSMIMNIITDTPAWMTSHIYMHSDWFISLFWYDWLTVQVSCTFLYPIRCISINRVFNIVYSLMLHNLLHVAQLKLKHLVNTYTLLKWLVAEAFYIYVRS